MPDVHVSLDTSVNPPVVTCDPPHLQMDRGTAPINWLPAENQDFTFASLTELPTSIFGTPTVTDGEITVTDNNQNNGPVIVYPYTLCVSYGNPSQTCCTGSGVGGNPGDPTVDNK